MAIHDLTTTPSSDIVVTTGLTLGAVALGVHPESAQSLSGAVGTLDFAGLPWKRFLVTGNLSGAFTFPPANIPTIPDTHRYLLAVEFVQDATGGRAMDLATLFGGATAIDGANTPDMSANKPTIVLISVRKSSGTTTYTAHLPPNVNGGQITFGTIPIARIQDGSAAQKGVLQLGSSSAAAAAGNHVHMLPDSRFFRIAKSDGSPLTNGDYSPLPDMFTSGTVVRFTDVQLFGGSSPTATVTGKIGTTAISGISIAANSTAPSADSDATANNSFVARQPIVVSFSDIAGNPDEARGVIHLRQAVSPI